MNGWMDGWRKREREKEMLLDIILFFSYYVKAQKILKQYQQLPSFHGIQQDCLAIVEQLKTALKSRLDDQQV